MDTQSRLVQLRAEKAERDRAAASKEKVEMDSESDDESKEKVEMDSESDDESKTEQHKKKKVADFRGRVALDGTTAKKTKQQLESESESEPDEASDQEEEEEEEEEVDDDEDDEEEHDDDKNGGGNRAHAKKSSPSSSEDEDDDDGEEHATASYGTTLGKDADTKRQKMAADGQRRKIPAAAASASTSSHSDAGSKKQPPNVDRNIAEWSSKHAGPVLGERFKRGDAEYEVVSLPIGSTGTNRYIQYKPSTTKMQMPDWANPSSTLDFCFDARNLSKSKDDPTAFETYVQPSRHKFYAVSQAGGALMIKNDPIVDHSPIKLRDFKARALLSKNLVPTVGNRPSPVGQRSWMPWCVFLAAAGSGAGAGGAAGGGASAGGKRKSPSAGGGAGAIEVPPLLLEKARAFVFGELAAFCRNTSAPGSYIGRLDCVMNNYSRCYWKVADLDELDVCNRAKFANLEKKKKDNASAAAADESMKLQIRMFLMVHVAGHQLVQELRDVLLKESTDAMDGADV